MCKWYDVRYLCDHYVHQAALAQKCPFKEDSSNRRCPDTQYTIGAIVGWDRICSDCHDNGVRLRDVQEAWLKSEREGTSPKLYDYITKQIYEDNLRLMPNGVFLLDHAYPYPLEIQAAVHFDHMGCPRD